MPEVKDNRIPYNETAESRRPNHEMLSTKTDQIIRNIIREVETQPPPRITLAPQAAYIRPPMSENKSFRQRHPLLFYITIILLSIAVIYGLRGKDNSHRSITSNTVSQPREAQNVKAYPKPQAPQSTQVVPVNQTYPNHQVHPEPEIKTEIYFPQKEVSNTQQKVTERHETVSFYNDSKIESAGHISREAQASINQERFEQPFERQPRWMTDPPEVFLRTRYLK